ncbi:MAG: tail fiber domain-containing protein [Candidatus Azobacteroides sp.]|nr:tail fiber domain-containing protein [Candidatus Azobacteroides sp.]
MKKTFLILASSLLTVNIYSQASWSLTGNAGTTTSNFLGTTDDNPLLLKANNFRAGFSGYSTNGNVSFGYRSPNPSAGDSNTTLGAQAFEWNSAGSGNVAIGRWTLERSSGDNNNVAIGFSALGKGSYNVAIGALALRNNTKNGNTAVGFEAGLNNVEGESLTAVGFKALWNNTTGGNNTALGFNALINNTTGFLNTAVGAWTLVGNTTGIYNTTIGTKSLYSNTTGEYNTAIGVQALEKNTTGFWNAALGSGALNQNITGYRNAAGGNSSMWFNTTGYENAAFGEQALAGNINGHYNTAIGCRALWSVELVDEKDVGYGHGNNNTAVGYESLREITTGSNNVSIGMHALRVTGAGNNNAAVGNYSLTFNTTGSDNVAVGNQALHSNITGSYNTAIGYNANVNASDLTNATAIGNGAVATASNQVTIGNSSVTSVRSYVPWTTISDGRIKKNIQSDVPGLEFIKLLQPVTYLLDLEAVDKILKIGKPQEIENDSLPTSVFVETKARAVQQKRKQTGFIAQDVEKAAQSIGYDFSGIDMDENGKSLYGLKYSKFIMPLVKAVQELSEQNDAKDAALASLQNQVEELTELVKRLLEKENGSTSDAKNIRVPDVSLEQNFPNPFSYFTTINYTLPQDSRFGKIVIADLSGRIFKQMSVFGPGAGSITIERGSLYAGAYYYSLYTNNTLIDTKKMVLIK